MARIIATTKPADTNLPSIIGGHRVTVEIHRDGTLAGHTTITGPHKVLRTYATERRWTWKADEPKPTPEPQVDDLETWAATAVSGTVADLEAVLADTDFSVQRATALGEAEAAGKDRTTAHEAINAWAAAD